MDCKNIPDGPMPDCDEPKVKLSIVLDNCSLTPFEKDLCIKIFKKYRYVEVQPVYLTEATFILYHKLVFHTHNGVLEFESIRGLEFNVAGKKVIHASK